MRILHLDSGRQMRGGQWQVFRLIEGLAAAGIESILLARAGSPLYQRAAEKGWRVEPWSFARVFWRARGCELVHAHDARSHTLAALAAIRKPLVVARRVAFGIRSHWKYTRAARYIAVSEHVKGVLVASGVPQEKIEVVYDGVPLLPRAAGTAVLAPANADDPRKGSALAVEAARAADIRLEFSGDLEGDLLRAGCFLYLTHTEGLGSAALLAMSAAVPVVASDVGGLREVITHRVNGLLVKNSVPAVAAALKEVTGNPALRCGLGEAARRTVEDRFTCRHMVERTIEVYRRVLA